MGISVQQWNENLANEVGSWDEEKLYQSLFLERHPDYPHFLLVNSLDPLLPHKLKEEVGAYSAVHILKLAKFYKAAEEAGYEYIFLDEVEDIVEILNHLYDPYPYQLNLGLKRFQIEGFNLTKDLPTALINWSTGTGKSVYAVARAKYLLESGKIDKVIVCSKNHNKINWKRQLKRVGYLDSEVAEAGGKDADTKRERRGEVYSNNPIFILNYEKLRWRENPKTGGDAQEILDAVKGKRVLWIFDEMPAAMKSMKTQHFTGVQKIMKGTGENYKVALTATKIEVDPENIYTIFKILDPTIWSNKQKFRTMYAKSMSTFSPWQVATWDAVKLRELGMRISHLTHRADKYSDPDIAKEFPQDHWDDILIDLSDQDRKLYVAAQKADVEDLGDEYQTILSKMNALQLICSNPELLNQSSSELAKKLAAKFNPTDKYSAKLQTLKDLLEQIDGKVVLFSAYNAMGMKMLAPYLVKWGHTFVMYDGKKKQEAEDRFRDDPRIKIFLSSDQGSDSINLEQATSVINFDLPANASTLIQRVNRISRITSTAEHVWYYNLICADTIEERKKKIIDRKQGFEKAIDQGIADAEIYNEFTLDELRWLVT